jgi:hypothetical protein
MSAVLVTVGPAGGAPRPACEAEHGQAERALCKETSTAGRRALEELPVGFELFLRSRRRRRSRRFGPFTTLLAGGLHPSSEEGKCFGSTKGTHLVFMDFLTIQAQTRSV